jgi:hypothetical protein
LRLNKKKRQQKGFKTEYERAQVKNWCKLARGVKVKKERYVCVKKLLGCGENSLCVIQWKSKFILKRPVQLVVIKAVTECPGNITSLKITPLCSIV